MDIKILSYKFYLKILRDPVLNMLKQYSTPNDISDLIYFLSPSHKILQKSN